MKNIKILFTILLLSYISIADGFSPEDAENAWDESFGPNTDYFYESNLPTGQGLDQFTTSIGQSFGLFFQKLECEDAPLIKQQYNFIKGTGAYVLFLADLYFPTIFAGFLVIMAITLVYLAGKFFESDQLVSIAKEEYWQTTLTAVRVTFIIGSIIAGNLWFNVAKNQSDPVYADSSTIIDAAMAYSKLITYKITNDLGAILVLNTFVHTLFSATVYIGITIKAMFSFQVGPILKPIVDILGVVIQFLSVAMGEWILHFITLCFIKKWTFSILVPIAFILRAFPQTRGGGDALLALLFSFAVIYPVMFLTSYEIYRLTSTELSPNDSLIESFFKNTGLFGLGLTALLFTLTLGSALVPFLMGLVISLVLEIIKNAVYYIVIISLLLPFMNIFLTLTSARESAKFFNIDVNFAAFVNLI